MSAATAQAGQIGSEVAYDLLGDHLELLLSLLETELPRGDVAERVGEATLRRFLRSGLLVEEGETLRASAQVFSQARQEGMMTFLQRYVLPSLTAGDDEGMGTLETIHLSLDEDAITGMRAGHVQSLLDGLVAASKDAPAGQSARLTVLVVGTSRVDADVLDPKESALHHLRNASLQRCADTERDRAVMTQWDTMADVSRRAASLEAVGHFLKNLEAYRVEHASLANYHLTVATHWQLSTAGELAPAFC